VELPHRFKLRPELRQRLRRQRHGPVLLSLAIMNDREHRIEVETVNPKFQTRGKSQPAAACEHPHQPEWGLQPLKPHLDLPARQHRGNI
jgi:hypothetical protein